MKRKNLIIGIVLAVLAICAGVGVYFFTREKPSEDALKFKEEYESLNGTIRESDGAKYNDIKIEKNNPIVYITTKEALEILDENQAIIYVGANWCPWCRNAIPVLFDIAESYKVDKIYYLNLDNEKSSYEVQDGEVVKTKDGSADYYKLLEKLSDRLEDYTLSKDGKNYETGEKRIYIPHVIGVKNGKVVADHVGTVTLESNQTKYDAMNDSQRKELEKIYKDLFEEVYITGPGSCNENVCD